MCPRICLVRVLPLRVLLVTSQVTLGAFLGMRPYISRSKSSTISGRAFFPPRFRIGHLLWCRPCKPSSQASARGGMGRPRLLDHFSSTPGAIHRRGPRYSWRYGEAEDPDSPGIQTTTRAFDAQLDEHGFTIRPSAGRCQGEGKRAVGIARHAGRKFKIQHRSHAEDPRQAPPPRPPPRPPAASAVTAPHAYRAGKAGDRQRYTKMV